MHNHEAEFFGQSVRGNLLHVHAVNIGDNALLAKLCANVTVQHNVRVLFHQQINGRGNNQNAVRLGYFGIIQRGGSVQNVLVNVRLYSIDSHDVG